MKNETPPACGICRAFINYMKSLMKPAGLSFPLKSRHLINTTIRVAKYLPG
jgi:hypothetical protein